MADKNTQKIGWIGMGRMGFPMAERLLKAGYDVSIWNRTRAKAEPLAAKGGKVVDNLSDLKGVDILFSIVSTGKDLEEVLFGKNGVTGPGRQGAEDLRRLLDHRGRGIRRRSATGSSSSAAISSRRRFPATPRSSRPAGLSAVLSGAEAACKTVMPLMEAIAPQGVSYVGEGELARVCKIAHNVMLGVVIENLIEITLLANKMGVPRHAFLAFMNNSVMGSMFTRYKSPGAGQSRLDHDVHA